MAPTLVTIPRRDSTILSALRYRRSSATMGILVILALVVVAAPAIAHVASKSGDWGPWNGCNWDGNSGYTAYAISYADTTNESGCNNLQAIIRYWDGGSLHTDSDYGYPSASAGMSLTDDAEYGDHNAFKSGYGWVGARLWH